MLHTIKTWVSQLPVEHEKNLANPFCIEMDVEEMFLEIPHSGIIPALVWIHNQLRNKKEMCSPVTFYIAKDSNRHLDNTLYGSGDFFSWVHTS